jgi:hypothetical protein
MRASLVRKPLAGVLVLLLAGQGGLAFAAQPATSSAPTLPDDNWPRQYTTPDNTIKLYQPQVDSWQGDELKVRAAVAVQAKGSKDPTFGVAWIEAHTDVDKNTRMVRIENVKITRVNFPSAPAANDTYLQILRQGIVSNKPMTIALDRLEADLQIAGEEKKADSHPVRNDPPRIVFSTTPALLILIDGEPAWRAVDGTPFQRVLNTRPLLLRDSTGVHYLHVYDGWMMAAALGGPWTVAAQPPSSLATAMQNLKEQNAPVDLLEGSAPQDSQGSAADAKSASSSASSDAKAEKPSLAKGPVPAIVVAMQPTELLVTEGEPDFVPLDGTQLLYVKNTTAHIFKDLADQKTYITISGRWYRASDPKAGPWEFVPGKSLPPDFANIPDESPEENVKASVPGTPQAQEALIANDIPQTAKVERSTAKITGPVYDGDPQLKAIDGTPLSYVINSSTPVIEVDPHSWYACQNGVWFAATAVRGPWVVADSVPAVIYSIPVSSPMHYVTYVKVYRSDPTTVYVSYTPGYCGTVVSDDVVVYGTGYYYPPWIGTYWFGPPVTWGFAFAPCWTLWGGWAFAAGFGWGFAWGMAPWWGPMGWGWGWGGYAWGPRGGWAAWGPGGFGYATGAVYQRWGNTASVSRYTGGFDAWTGNAWRGRGGASYNSRTGNLAVGQRGAIGNVYTGNYAAGGRGVVHNTSTGVTAAGRAGTIGNVNGNSISGGKGVVYDPRTGKATNVSGITGSNGGGAAKIGDTTIAKGPGGNEYFAGRDGNVYQKGGDGNWQGMVGGNGSTRKTGGGSMQWQGMNDPGLTRDLDRSWNARSMGDQRWGSFRGGFGGGGFHGGGGGFRRR